MAAYTLYDVLRMLVNDSRRSEEEKRVLIESVNEAEDLAVLGTVARNIECPHPSMNERGKCTDCGRTLEIRDPGPYPRRYWKE